MLMKNICRTSTFHFLALLPDDKKAHKKKKDLIERIFFKKKEKI